MRSKLSDSNRWLCASACSNVTLRSPLSAMRLRAPASIGSEMSTPTTRPRSPTASAKGTVAAPVPQPISSARSPGATADRASSR
jgi:hypothetical protein